jgi:hypothetical protein
MDQLIASVMNGNFNSTSLLLLFIVGILTKRFVPWWIHEEVLDKLHEYEDAAPQLVEQVTDLIDLLNGGDVSTKTLREKQRTIERIAERKTRHRPRRRVRERQ